MKLLPFTLVLTAFSVPVFASCDSLKEQISQKIINNGVAESAFSLTVESATGANPEATGKIVGHCENNTQVIVYTKHGADSVKTTNTETAKDPNVSDKHTDK
jgi:hypothetical protein